MYTEDVKMLMDIAEEKMQKTIEHLDNELRVVRAGRANPAMLSGIVVDYYGTATPLQQVASVSSPDARSIVIQPWEKKMIQPIEKAIMAANLGFNPQNNGETVRIMVPPLTEERRKDLVKQVKQIGENARVSLRSTRHETIDEIKKLQKTGLGEDLAKDNETKAQKLTDNYNKKIDELLDKKEKEILTV